MASNIMKHSSQQRIQICFQILCYKNKFMFVYSCLFSTIFSSYYVWLSGHFFSEYYPTHNEQCVHLLFFYFSSLCRLDKFPPLQNKITRDLSENYFSTILRDIFQIKRRRSQIKRPHSKWNLANMFHNWKPKVFISVEIRTGLNSAVRTWQLTLQNYSVVNQSKRTCWFVLT